MLNSSTESYKCNETDKILEHVRMIQNLVDAIVSIISNRKSGIGTKVLKIKSNKEGTICISFHLH
jgi:hypothetical protein